VLPQLLQQARLVVGEVDAAQAALVVRHDAELADRGAGAIEEKAQELAHATPPARAARPASEAHRCWAA
jgi:hypothetical protein